MIGKPGGITGGSAEARSKTGGEDAQEALVAAGPYDPLKLHNPAGLVVSPDGHLWVTENERWKPKRLAAYDPATGTMWKEFFGPTAYGASGCGFDPEEPTRWIGQGTLFKLDFQKKTAVPVSTLGGKEGRHYRFWRQDGRTFVIAYGKATYIEELLPDNTLKPLACYSSAHLYAYAHSWKPSQEFVEAFRRDYPNVKYDYGRQGQPGHGYGMLWVDRDGDGRMQAGEIEFSTAAESSRRRRLGAGLPRPDDADPREGRRQERHGHAAARRLVVGRRAEVPGLQRRRQSRGADRSARPGLRGNHDGPLREHDRQQRSGDARLRPRRPPAVALSEPLVGRPRLAPRPVAEPRRVAGRPLFHRRGSAGRQVRRHG